MNCTFKSAIGLWGMSVFPTMVMGNGVAELSVKKDNRPNILIIFTDDQGYADLECFGSKTHNTPNMNKLAREGVMFTEFYAQSQSMPSRSRGKNTLRGFYRHFNRKSFRHDRCFNRLTRQASASGRDRLYVVYHSSRFPCRLLSGCHADEH